MVILYYHTCTHLQGRTMRKVKAETKVETVAVTVQVPRERLLDAITAGMIQGPHGYGYWCSSVNATGCFTDQEIARHVLGGGTATVEEIADDAQDDIPHVLTKAKFLKGYALYLADHRNHDEIDAPTSDRIMQFAIFGEQKYG
jgi:hypothetical protein